MLNFLTDVTTIITCVCIYQLNELIWGQLMNDSLEHLVEGCRLVNKQANENKTC